MADLTKLTGLTETGTELLDILSHRIDSLSVEDNYLVTSIADFSVETRHNCVNMFYNFGCVCYMKKDVPKNLYRAFKFFQAAAMLEDVDAQYKLAHMYEHGEGVPKSAIEAAKWYKAAWDITKQGKRSDIMDKIISIIKGYQGSAAPSSETATAASSSSSTEDTSTTSIVVHDSSTSKECPDSAAPSSETATAASSSSTEERRLESRIEALLLLQDSSTRVSVESAVRVSASEPPKEDTKNSSIADTSTGKTEPGKIERCIP
jgi:hypothetical protein